VRKQGSKRKKLQATAPMMVLRMKFDTELTAKEVVAAKAFTWGAATKQHYDTLLDLANMLMVGGHSAPDRKWVLKLVDEEFMPALRAVKERFDRTGKMGVTAQEGDALMKLTAVSKSFWNRVPIQVYHKAAQELQAYYEEIAERREMNVGHGDDRLAVGRVPAETEERDGKNRDVDAAQPGGNDVCDGSGDADSGTDDAGAGREGRREVEVA
jgi:hypothetical protein